MPLELSEPHTPADIVKIEALILSLAATEAALIAMLPDEIDAVINPTTATPMLLHRAQAALQTSEGRYRNLLSRMAAIVFELEPDGTVLYVNDAVESATGYPAQALLGKSWWGIFFPGEQYGQVIALNTRLSHGDVSNFELRLTTRSNSTIALEVNTANHYTSDGTLQKILGLGVDITERTREEQHRRFLAESSAALATSLDYQTTLTKLAQLVVPTLADWCIVHILDKDGTVQEVAVTHRDMDKAARTSALARNYPPEPNSKSPVWRVLQTGKAELYPEISAAMLVGRSRDADHLAFLREIGFASLMVVPLVARGQTFGAVQFVLSQAGHRFDESDLALAEELCRRAANAIDNSRLYQEIHEQHERLQITLSSIGDAVIATDIKGRVSFMNDVAQSLTGWTQDEAQGSDLEQVFHIIDETNRQPAENPVVKVIRGGTTVGLANHTVLIAQDGTEFHIDNNGAPIRDESGAIVGAILVFHDVTEQRRAQIALRDSEQRFRAIFDQAVVGMTQITLDGRWLLVNESFCKMLGYSQEELLDHNLSDFTHPDDLPGQLEQRRQILAGELQSFTVEKRYIRKDGSVVWAKVTSSPVRSTTGKPGTYVSIIEDITERKRADEQVRFQARLLDTVGQSIIATDLQDKIIYWNQFAEELYGWSAVEALDHNVADLVISHRTPEQAAEMLASLRNGENWTGEFSIERRDKTTFPARVTNSPIYDASGMLVGIIRLSADISERKLVDEQMRFQAHLLDIVGQSVVATDLQNRIIYWNHFAAELYGWSAAEALGRNILELIVNDLTRTRTVEIREKINNDEYSSAEFVAKRRDGTTFSAFVNNSPLNDASGALVGIIGVSMDISERKLVDEQMRFQAHLLDTVAQSVVATDLQNRIIYWNHFAAELYGWSAAEALGHDIVDFIVHDVTQARTAEIRDRLRNHENWTGEYVAKKRDGTTFSAFISNSPLYDASSVLVGIIGVSMDISERKQAEQALVDERNILRTLIDNLPDYIFTKDVEGRFVVSNAAHAHAVQREPAMLVGKTAAELFGQDLAPNFDADDLLVLHTGQPLINVERTTTDATGNLRGVLTTKVALRDHTGQIVGLVGISRDVTERKYAEEALRISEAAEREQRLLAEALLDSSVTLTSVLDPAIVMNRILENVSRVLSNDSSNIMLVDGDVAYIAYWRGYKDLDGFFKRERFPLNSPLLNRMLETRLPIIIDDVTAYPGWASRDASGGIRSHAAAPIQAHGQIIGFLNIDNAEPNRFTALDTKGLQAFANQAAIAIENAQLYDELRRHAAELEGRVDLRTAELHQATEHLESIFNSSTDAIVVVGRDGLIARKNTSFSSLFGDQADVALGQPITALAAPDSVDALTDALSDVIAKATPRQIELVVQHKNGTEFDVDMILSPIVGPDHQTTEVICNVRDITQRKLMETGLRQTLDKERELGELKSRFLSMASHDFRTPLAVILSSASLLKLYNEKMATETRLKHLNKIHVGVNQMTELLEDLLTFTQEGDGRLEYKPVAVDLEALCREMMEETQIANGKSHEFVFSCNGNCPDALIDKKLLRQIVNNLLSNAAKYSPEGSVVNFDLECEPERAVLRVQDHGIGIPEKDQPRIFEPFHRAGNVNAVRGTGLGLAIVKRAAELHNGSIQFESHVGVGTTFTVIISTSQEAEQ